jgi:hypothetical protein
MPEKAIQLLATSAEFSLAFNAQNQDLQCGSELMRVMHAGEEAGREQQSSVKKKKTFNIRVRK